MQMETIFIGQDPRGEMIACANLKQTGHCGLNCAPKKDMLTSLALVPVNITFLGNRAFEDGTMLR